MKYATPRLSAKLRLSVTIAALLIAGRAHSAIRWNAEVRALYVMTLELQLDKAREKVKAAESRQPDNQAFRFIENYENFLDLLINDRHENYESFTEQCNKLIDRLEEESDDNAYKNYLISDLYLQKAWVLILDESYLSAAFNLSKAGSHIKANDRLHPGFVPNNKALGLMNIALGSIPDNYGWLAALFGMKGSVQEGMKQLQRLTRASLEHPQYRWLATESIISYLFSSRQITTMIPPPSLLSKIEEYKHSTNNQLVSYALASYYRKLGQNDKVIKQLRSCPLRPGYQRFYYLDYMLGAALLYQNSPETVQAFTQYLQAYPGRDYRKAARLRLAWYYHINNRPAEAHTQLHLLTDEGRSFFDSDKAAQIIALKDELPRPELLKARLYFDGGYYGRCRQTLLSISKAALTADELLEYTYRLGRLYDDWGKKEQAIPYYQSTIEKGKDSKHYYAANAALHLGYIYESRGRKDQAIALFNSILDMDFVEYRNSITREAKTALNRLEQP